MVGKFILFNISQHIFSEEEKVVNETTKLVSFHFLDVHTSWNDNRFKEIEVLMFLRNIFYSKTKEVLAGWDSLTT